MGLFDIFKNTIKYRQDMSVSKRMKENDIQEVFEKDPKTKKDIFTNGNLDENNPKTAQQVLKELSNEPFFTNNFDKILLSIIPDIESVNYGRAVGYNVIYHEPPKDIEEISGTAIRNKYIDSNGDEVIYRTNK